ncbi:condensation domain-containing protein, partial [Streptomyces sp. NPDC001833]|uniref:condensation domain-containing protein n=1 Tax=Streptomyces sp. NPDC001833 TaxID=3154658 RepID=UPI003321CF0C
MIPLSSAQRRLWFLAQMEGPGATYNNRTALRLSGTLDRAALEAALRDVIARHEALRTVFPAADGEPHQRILPADDLPWRLDVVQVADDEESAEPHRELRTADSLWADPLTELPVIEPAPDLPGATVTRAALAAAVARTSSHAFDLAREIPIRAWLFAVRPDEHVLVLVVHHIAWDDWSIGPLARDLSTAYTARHAGHAPAWEPLPVQYADYALWQREVLGEEDDPDSVLAVETAYWREALAGLPEEPALPTDRPRPSVPGHRGHTVTVQVPADLHGRLADLARQHGATAFMLLQTALAVTLHRLGAGTDIPIGSPIAGRTDEALEDLVGCFVNSLVIRHDLTGDPTFEEALSRTRATALGAFGHHEVPFEHLVEQLAPTRSRAHNPLFQVMLTLQNAAHGLVVGGTGAMLRLPGLHTEELLHGSSAARYDLWLHAGETFDAQGAPAGIRGVLRAAADLFEAETVRRLARVLVRVLTAMTDDPAAGARHVDVLDAGEREAVLETWNDTAVDLGAVSVPELFAERVAATPDAVAVVAGGESVSYAELDARANRVACWLLDRGVGAESVVGLCLPRGAETVAGMLGVWKAGAAYLPIDPGWPAERVGYVLADSGAEVVLDGEVDLAGVPEAAPEVVLDPGQVAYVIYTSGSTGRPKGVAVPHGALANYVGSVPGRVGFDGPGRYAVLQGQATDLGNTVVFASLTGGGELHVLDEELVTDPGAVARYLAGHEIDFLKAVPSHVAALGARSVSPARSLVLGGEAASPQLVEELLAGGCQV